MSVSYTSFFIGVCFTLNYIIGTGFLTLPWAFNQTGWVLGFLTLSILTVFSIMVVVFVLEAMARAERIENKDKEEAKSYGMNSSKSTYSIIPDTSQHYSAHNNSNHNKSSLGGSSALTSSSSSRIESHFEMESTEDRSLLNKSHKLLVKGTVYEIPELADIFLGKYGKISYTFFVSLYLFSALWAYATVFGLAFAAHLNIGKHSYEIYILIFSIFVVPMSLMEFKEQICVQVFLSICRVLMVLIMISTILYAKYNSAILFGDFQPDLSHHDAFSSSNWKNIYLLLPIAAYANIFHHSIPALAQLVADKSILNEVFFTALFIAMISYTSLGAIVSSYFRANTMISSNLNWAHFHCKNGDSELTAQIAHILSTFVVLFPAFDVASAFPLNAITLANNLMSYYDGQDVHIAGNSRFHRIIFRIVTVCPAILLAINFPNLGEVTHFAGLAGFAIAFIYPALLAYYSKKRLDEEDIPSDTAYSISFLSTTSNMITTFVGVGLIMFVTYSLITAGPIGR